MRLQDIRSDTRIQLVLGLFTGIAFGFLLNKGGVTDYDVIIGQLLLTDFTVIKVMLSAVLVGMVGIFAMKGRGLVALHCRSGSVGATVTGGLIFGAGFAVLGYCPGTAAGAVGTGALDAAIGMAGIALGAGIYARLYPVILTSPLNTGTFPAGTVPELIGIRPGITAAIVAILILAFFGLMAALGL